MFIVFAIPIGLVAGWLLGGRLDELAETRLRLVPLAIAALLVQFVLFSPVGGSIPDGLSRVAYVASTALVVAVVLANIRLPGLPLVAVGAAANLIAIIANGGAMPADPAALAAAGIELDGPSNSVVVAEPAVRPLTDIFALPRGLPLANVFSVGDVLIALGIAIAIAALMRRRVQPAI